jgi:transcriptional regulator with XRE-family HTH domain
MVLAHIELRTDKLTDLRRVAGLELDAELARRMGIRQSSLLRVLNNSSKPGAKFIAGLLEVLGGEHWFEQLFYIAPDEPK